MRSNKKKQIFAENRVSPLKNCNFGFSVHFKLCLKKKSIKGSVQKTVKKYLAQVIWKKDNSADKYFAIASIKGSITHADKFKVIAFIMKNILMLYIL